MVSADAALRSLQEFQNQPDHAGQAQRDANPSEHDADGIDSARRYRACLETDTIIRFF
jgi:hypothetical protein